MKPWMFALFSTVLPLSVSFATGPVVTPACVVSWDANIETDLAGYTVFVTQISGAYGPGKMLAAPYISMTCTTAGVDRDGQWYATVLAFDTTGNQSPKAAEYAFFVQTPPPPDTTPPDVPTGFKVEG